MLRLLTFCLLILLAPRVARPDSHPEWTTPIPPFQIADNLFYVGSQDLAAYLITTPRGNILINANLVSSPAQIHASIERLGFKWADTRILLNSQAHFDHAAGTAQVLRETHARNMVMDGDASVVESGARTDFLAPSPNVPGYAPAHVDRILHDGDLVKLGPVTLTAHKTAGHTRGCTTWTFSVHLPGEPADQLRNVIIVGGVGFWSEYHFLSNPVHRESYPGIAADFTRTFATLHALPCDLFLGAHGSYFGMTAKLERLPAEGPRVFIDPGGYQAFIHAGQSTFEQALARERTAAKSVIMP